MSGRCISLVVASILLLTTSALAQPQPETSQLYLERRDSPRRIALAADFMRIFCTDQTMAPASLADCLDKDATNGQLFERAIACVASGGR
jgi:hypothetical protein